MITCTCDGHSHICDECSGKIETIWYEPLVEALRHHIEAKHMMETDALEELGFAEEYLAYDNFGDDEKVKIVCPWSSHCNCDWEIVGHISFKLDRIKIKDGNQTKLVFG